MGVAPLAWPRPDGELIRGLLEPLSGPLVLGCAWWRKGRVSVSSEFASDRRARNAFIRDVVNSIGHDAGYLNRSSNSEESTADVLIV